MESLFEDNGALNSNPNLILKDAKFITGFQYYLGYDEKYNPVSFLEVDFLIESRDQKNYFLKIKFNCVSSLDLIGFGDSYNQLMGLDIQKLDNRGFEQGLKYFVRDYENDIIKFYCAGFEILSFVEG